MILTLEMIVTLIIAIACVSVEVLIAISLSRRWLKYRPKTLAIFLLALLALLFADSSALVAMFLTDQELLIFVYKLSLIGSMISICLLLFNYIHLETDNTHYVLGRYSNSDYVRVISNGFLT